MVISKVYLRIFFEKPRGVGIGPLCDFFNLNLF